MVEVGVIGAGSWGIALAKLLHTNGNKVTVWSIVEDEIKMLKEKHEHVDKLLHFLFSFQNYGFERRIARSKPDLLSSCNSADDLLTIRLCEL